MYYIIEKFYAVQPEVRFSWQTTVFEIIPIEMYLNQVTVDELINNPDSIISEMYPIRLLAVSHEPYHFIATNENERLFVAWKLGLVLVEFKPDPQSELYYSNYSDEIDMVKAMARSNYLQAEIRSWADLEKNLLPPDEYLLKTEESVIAMRLLGDQAKQPD